ncbi:MAG: type II secretion system protein [Lachnospiraceae bacterium]|nr:type II secretion system protein [Lachnospiraceae bacterium]
MKKTMKKVMRNNEGFTLVELIIVVAIIALLIAMIAPNLTSFLGTASDTTRQANAKTAYTSANAWLTQMRVDGVSCPDYSSTPLSISVDAGALKLSDTTLATAQADGLKAMFNVGEFKSDTVVKIYAKNYVVSKVEWVDGTAGTGTYPKTTD